MRSCFVFLFLFQAIASADVEELDLPKAIGLALSNSHEVKKSIELKQAAEASVRRVRANFFPKVSIEVLAGTYHDRLPTPGSAIAPTVASDRNNYAAGLKATQSLFAGFRDSSAYAKVNTQKSLADKELQIA